MGGQGSSPSQPWTTGRFTVASADGQQVLPGCQEVPPGSCSPLSFYLVFSPVCCRNAEKILGYLHTNVLSQDLIPPHVNFSHLTTKDYSEMYKVIMTVKEDRFSALGLDPCLLEDELDKVWDGLGGRWARGGWGLGEGSRKPPGTCSFT